MRPSRYLAAAMIVLYGATLVLLMLYALPWWLKSLIATAIMASFWFSWRRHVILSSPKAVTEVQWTGDEWRVYTAPGRETAASLLGTTFVHHRFLVLNFKVPGERWIWPVLILPDSTEADYFRRLVLGVRRASSPQNTP